MARHKRDYSGEKRTACLRVQVTPSERATLERGAEKQGTTLSQYTRELCLRRSAATQIVAGTKRDPQARAVIAELTAIGNNLNQLAKIANTAKAAPQLHEIRATTDMLKVALSRVLGL